MLIMPLPEIETLVLFPNFTHKWNFSLPEIETLVLFPNFTHKWNFSSNSINNSFSYLMWLVNNNVLCLCIIAIIFRNFGPFGMQISHIFSFESTLPFIIPIFYAIRALNIRFTFILIMTVSFTIMTLNLRSITPLILIITSSLSTHM